MIVKLFAALFIVYELLKIAKAEWFLNLYEKINKQLETENTEEILKLYSEKSFISLLVVEIIYILFSLSLLLSFTSYSIVGAFLLFLGMMFYKKKNNVKNLVIDGALSTLILLLIFTI